MNDLLEYHAAKLDELKIQLDLLGVKYQWNANSRSVNITLINDASRIIIELGIGTTLIHIDSQWGVSTRYIKTCKNYQVTATKDNIDRACNILLIVAVRISKGDKGK